MHRFYDDPLGFVMFAYPWKTDKSLQLVKLPEKYRERFPDYEFGPDLWACEFLEELGEEVKKRGFNGRDPVAPIREAVASGHGIGKGHRLDIQVDTPNGRAVWGDLKPGNIVFGENGEPVLIKAINMFNAPFYRVKFDDRSYCDVSSGHLWKVKGRQERRKGLDQWRTMETIQILEAGVKRPNGVSGARQWELPVQGAAQFEEREIDLHPYFVGLWLGDGIKGHPAYAKPYPEIKERLIGFGYKISSSQDNLIHRLLSVSQLLVDPVFSCYSHERYIPDDYKYNTIENRLELFRGLCDSDGEIHASGSIGYSTSSRKLAADVVWLARSLGCKAMIQPTIKQPFYKDKQGQRIDCKDSYRVTINAPFNPFTIKRRKEKYKPSEPRYLKRWIDSIEYIGEKDGMCIEVDSKDGMYLANDFIPTHNSTIVAWLVDWIMSTRPFCIGTITASTAPQLQTKTWAQIAKWTKICITGHWFEISSGKGNMKMWHKQNPTSWFCSGQTCKEENSEAFAGQHAANSTSFYIFDESSRVPDAIKEVAEGGLTDGEPMMFAFGNPTRNSGWFYDCFHSMRHRWIIRKIDSRRVQITNKSQIAEWLEDQGEEGENSDFFKVRVRGEFPAMSINQLISRDLAELAARRRIAYHQFEFAPVIIGVDCAWEGDDMTVVMMRQGNASQLLGKWQNIDDMVLGSMINQWIDEYDADATFIDQAWGSGVISYLRHVDQAPIPINFGSNALNPIYKFKRTEMWCEMALWLTEGGVIPNNPRLIDDLCAPDIIPLSNGQKMLEKKKDMKARGLPSPDFGDSLALTFSDKVSKREISEREMLLQGRISKRNQNSRKVIDLFSLNVK